MKWIASSMLILGIAISLSAQTAPSVCADVLVLANQGRSELVQPPFITARIIELSFEIELSPPMSGSHVLEIDLFTPNGHRYQTLTTPITDIVAKANSPTIVQGYPDPLPAKLLLTSTKKRGVESQKATMRLPVAGTPILTNSLYGEWGVKVRLDKVEISCGELRSFIIPPPQSALIFADGFESGTTESWQ
jgi:hypothetical protein